MLVAGAHCVSNVFIDSFGDGHGNIIGKGLPRTTRMTRICTDTASGVGSDYWLVPVCGECPQLADSQGSLTLFGKYEEPLKLTPVVHLIADRKLGEYHPKHLASSLWDLFLQS